MMLQHAHADRAPERVVVLGATGFVGGAVCRRLAAAGIDHVGLCRREVDLQAADAAQKLAAHLRPADAVVVAAARAPCKSTAMLAENVIMLEAIVDALGGVPVCHVVHVSSDAVYADAPVPLTERSATAPGTLHGAMHVARDLALASELKLPLAIVRPSLLYGLADPHDSYGPNRFRRLATQGKDIVLFGEGEERRDHVLIDDVAELIFRVLLRGSTGTLNIATGAVHSFRSIAEMVVAAAERKVAITSTPRIGPMPHNGYRPFNPAACRAAFPDFSYVGLPEGIRRVQREMEQAGG
jgi:nucleoside-diphosphate-sugar epimerase